MNYVMSALRKALREDRPILIAMAVVWGSFVLLLAAEGVNGLRITSYGGNLLLYAVTAAVLALFAMIGLLYRVRPDSPISFLSSRLADARTWERWIRGLPILAALVVFMPVFSAMKSAIPLFTSYDWDGTLVSADQAIHGMDTWRLIQPILGHPLITSALSYAYHAWLFLVYAGSIYFCFFARDRELRARYFIGYFSIWTVIGVAMATGLASVGPCFLADFTGDHRFDEQIAYLSAANERYPILVLEVQQMLLNRYHTGDHGLASGISAMPSMHVAMALLFALSIRQVNKRAGAAAFVFFAAIQVASVHLAYHYAVDGYVSIVVTVALWKLAKPLARWSVRRNAESKDINSGAPQPRPATV